MFVLGIDPGTATTGFGFVREHDDGSLEAVHYGVITTPAKMPMPDRLHMLYSEMSDLIATYKPEAAAIETLFFGKNVTTAITVAQGRGVVLLALAQAGLTIREYKPAEIKQAIAGYGNAEKSQMQEMIRQLLNLEQIPRPDDAADGLGVAITDLNASRYERMAWE
ncbi:MAG TPA: crossover junction endodeoxyribonuclease RuvC [Aggregatilinea sp.]|jgi:crossover junction endodeoxyribonuclease RuvC|uniref:crossover junction endodeoxyribonuclease RuvC n=1 Tax=Aggregatilinea sp. TaxID=2806333 RepID=UPI002B9ED94C|nr:crossover junction endodeoxyribonuclease RuvC [Aggregatilinea sp.]HML22244.1 crossover junction endodeoxyribonuclease RuvC [Aggregatilinea sp.]